MVIKRPLPNACPSPSFFTQCTAFPKRQILDSSKLEEFADNNFKFDENGRKISKRVENTVEKRRNCSFSKDLYSRHVKTRACLGKGEKLLKKLTLFAGGGGGGVSFH